MSISVQTSIVLPKNNTNCFLKMSYNDYRNDIQNFDMENYLKDKYESEKIKSVSDFLEMYKVIEDEDSKKPIFSQTTKFKKFPNHLKYYKYVKFYRDEESKKKWSVLKPENETEKIIIFINTCLNKITEQNILNVQKEWMEEFIKFDHPDLFELVFNAIYDKCINDSKYLPLYITLAQSLWDNFEIHQQRYEIINLDDDYYVRFKYGDKEFGAEKLNEEKSLGPYTNESECHNEAYLFMNFKRYFIDKLEKKFKTRDITFAKEDVDDNEFFDKKRQLMGLIDILLHLFKEKIIHMDIIHIMILQLFHINHNEFEPIEEIEVECIHKMIKFLCINNFINKQKYYIFEEYISLFNNYLNSDKEKVNQSIISTDKITNKTKRAEFFLNEMNNMLDNPVKYNFDNNINIWNEKDSKLIISKIIQQNNYKNLREYIDYNLITDESKNKVFEYILNTLIDKKEFRKDWNIIFDNSQNIDIWYEKMTNIINNIQDISIDIPDISKRLEKMIKELRLFNNKQEEWMTIINKFKEDNESNEDEWEKMDEDTVFSFAKRF